ncbi:16S rRNA (cytosine(1402)-N(4))-methyltransferase RsmH [Tannockella kyphosi]|uniref:16S rRNA (cytosine(1402)-N(4))-methyltransferase RsmH n=1 Tax=Tannockella kyphosi TaxID=2899121 RepID=UPI00201199C9|nr:16S rRNA (cytosine(1402)-N(4))-methyltransferase RsmH [Tannockella kyphosi]
MDNEQKTHKRRVRYKGTHPTKFHEKYKEHNPDKYKDDIEKIIKKGNTPAGMHISICVQEIIDFLEIKPGQIGLDATLGYGGHTSKMLEQLQGTGHVYGLDIDPIEIEKTKARLLEKGFDETIFSAIHTNFKNIDHVAREYGPFDFILADLGVSSMQIDDPSRGFSFKRESPLDLRLNPNQGIPASERLTQMTYNELRDILESYSDEPYASPIAKAIMKNINQGNTIDTTTKLKVIIEEIIENDKAVPFKQREITIKKTCQRTFQALRMDVNNEYDVLYDFLEKLPEALKSGGRVAILTFHSGEDRLVKKAFKELKNLGIYSDVTRDVIRPSKEECFQNPRATSTKMRWAIKA